MTSPIITNSCTHGIIFIKNTLKVHVQFTPTCFRSQMEPSSGGQHLILAKVYKWFNGASLAPLNHLYTLARISCWPPEDGSICDPKHVGVNCTWTFNVFLINTELWVHELVIIDTSIPLPFHDHGTRRGWGVRHAPAALYPRERPGTHFTGGWVGPRAGLDRCGKSRPPPGFDPTRSQSLYRVSYPRSEERKRILYLGKGWRRIVAGGPGCLAFQEIIYFHSIGSWIWCTVVWTRRRWLYLLSLWEGGIERR